jgi:hypothetical protein
MTWLRENDDEATDPKTLALIGQAGYEAYYRLHRLRQWCAQHETGGTFGLATSRELGVKSRHLAAMLAAGLVDSEGGGAYQVHDWRSYNPTDPTADRRMRAYRERQRYAEDRNEGRNVPSNVPSNAARHGDAATGTYTNTETTRDRLSSSEAVDENADERPSAFKIPDVLRDVP